MKREVVLWIWGWMDRDIFQSHLRGESQILWKIEKAEFWGIIL